MHRRTLRLVLSVLLLMGCGDGAAMDAGLDASVDAGEIEIDGGGDDAGGRDAGMMDAGLDAGPGDAGTDAGASGGDAGPRDAGGFACDPSSLTFDSFIERYSVALCSLSRRCETYPPAWLFLFLSAFCHPAVIASGFAPLRAEVDAGRVLLDPARACSCLDGLSVPTCDTVWRGLLGCAGWVRHSTRPTTCSGPVDCDPGQVCMRPGDVCPGTCDTLPGLGDACGGAIFCAIGLSCVAARCEPMREIGESCDSTWRCQPYLYCDGSGVCTGPAAAGASCGDGAWCVDGLVCTGGVCAAGGLAGARCDLRDRCALRHRCEGSSSRCVRALLPGDACVDTAECPPGFACDGTCTPRPVVGDACPMGDCLGTCVSGTCAPSVDGASCERLAFFIDQCAGACDPATSLCVAPLPAGADCLTGIRCASGLECSGTSHTCVAACVP